MDKNKIKIPILGFAAFSGVGKTTLLVKIIPLLKQKKYRVAVIKHAHHAFDIDKKGKDSFELRKAGASHMLIASNNRWALMVENSIPSKPKLEEYIVKLNEENIDLILVEGFKSENIKKIELHRHSLGHPLICKNDKNIIAIASDDELEEDIDIKTMDINNHKMIVDFIINDFINKQSK